MSLNLALPIVNAFAVLFIAVPSAWHARARNTATLLYIFWCMVTVLPNAINGIIWYNTVESVAPVWCDITTKLRIGADVGLAAATLCITRQLEAIAAARQVNYTREDLRRRTIIDLLLAVGLPILVMISHVVVQGHRFDILQRVGCIPTLYWSIPSILLVSIWPIILYSISSVYACIAIQLFLTRRYQLIKILASSKSAISPSRFIRLIALASIQIICNLPLPLILIAFDAKSLKLNPYKSWSSVHFNFDHVYTETIEQWNQRPIGARSIVVLTLWIYPLSCALFFLFFGLGEESVASYRRGWTSVRRGMSSAVFSRKSWGRSSVLDRAPQRSGSAGGICLVSDFKSTGTGAFVVDLPEYASNIHVTVESKGEADY